MNNLHLTTVEHHESKDVFFIYQLSCPNPAVEDLVSRMTLDSAERRKMESIYLQLKSFDHPACKLDIL